MNSIYRVNTALLIKLRVIVRPVKKRAASGYAFRVKLKSYYETGMNDAEIIVLISCHLLRFTSLLYRTKA